MCYNVLVCDVFCVVVVLCVMDFLMFMFEMIVCCDARVLCCDANVCVMMIVMF